MDDSGAAAPFPSRWRLQQAQLIADTHTSLVWKVLREDGTTAVVKALKPAGSDERYGLHLLRWRSGHGLIRLYASAGHTQLLEYAGDLPLSQIIDRDGDTAATDIAADVLQRLSAPSRKTAPSGLQPLPDYFAGLFTRANATAPHSAYRDAAQLATRLFRDARRVQPLHGDLHHDNILQGPRGWLAIDPRGLIGEAAFDVANLLYNPLERDDLCLDPQRLLQRAETYARVLRLELPLILDYAYAYGCLSAAWHAEDDNAVDESRELAVATRVRELRRSL